MAYRDQDKRYIIHSGLLRSQKYISSLDKTVIQMSSQPRHRDQATQGGTLTMVWC